MEIIHSKEKIINGTVTLVDYAIISNFTQIQFVNSKKSDYSSNDFELQIKSSDWNNYSFAIGDWIYIPETEYGGRIEIIDHSDDDSVKVSGPNLRYAFLNNIVICPPYDESLKTRSDYLNINAEANNAIKIMLDNSVVENVNAGYKVSDESSAIIIKCQCRYEYALEKITSVLDEYNLRLKVEHSYDYDVPFIISAIAKDEIDDVYNQDYKIVINSSYDETKKYDVIIGLGKGDLSDRQVVIMQRTDDNEFIEVELNQVLHQNNLKQYVYDYPSVESLEELKKGIIEKFQEYVGTNEVSLEVKNNDIDLNLGAKVVGADNITGLEIESEITQKTITINSSSIKYNYKVGE